MTVVGSRFVMNCKPHDDADVFPAPVPMSQLPLGLARRAPVCSHPARTATRSKTSPVRSPAGVSATIPISDYSAPPALVGRQLPSNQQRSTLPVSLPLPCLVVTGPCPAAAGHDPEVPITAGIRVVDPLSTIWRSLTDRTVSTSWGHSCIRLCLLLWPGLRHSTPRGHRCPTCHRSSCHPMGYVLILISIQSIWILCV